MINDVNPENKQFAALKRGFNLRFPEIGCDPSRILVCSTVSDVLDEVNIGISSGVAVKVRSGGHCYEGFTANSQENGILIDVGALKGISFENGLGFGIECGVQNWDAISGLYKLYNRTLPGGSCYSVAVGGHISGGGFGWLSRADGITVDHLTAIDIVLAFNPVDNQSVATKVTAVRGGAHGQLFKLCAGGGGGSVGIITKFYFEKLPEAPAQVKLAVIQFSWKDLATDPISFKAIIRTFGEYFATRGQEPDTDCLFSIIKPTFYSAGTFSLRAVLIPNRNGIFDDAILDEFIGLFKPFARHILTNTLIQPTFDSHSLSLTKDPVFPGTRDTFDWITWSQNFNGSGTSQRGKYKSSHMKSNFNDYELGVIFNYLTNVPKAFGGNSQAVFQIDSYGGKINRQFNSEQTAVSQRSSVIKLQLQIYWTNPAEDEEHIRWINKFYADLYSASNPNIPAAMAGAPWPGCVFQRSWTLISV